MTTSNPETTCYRIDKEKRILSISGPWDRFAEENQGEAVRADEVRGRSLWEFVTGDTTRMWMDTLLQLAAVRNEVVERPYRCDSPDLRRHMTMRIEMEEPGVFRIEHELLAQEKRPTTVHVQHFSRQAAGAIRSRCSVCGRIASDGGWSEPDECTGEDEIRLTVTYTVCDDCRPEAPSAAP